MDWKLPLLSVVSLVVFFSIVEGLLWIAGVETLFAESDPFQGFSDQVRVYELDARRNEYRTPRGATRSSFNPQSFAAEKPENGFRLFALGGSSAYGFPWGAEVAFPRPLGDALQASWPDRKIEAVNAGAMSYGSHRLRILTPELLGYEPDVLVIYGGHNEFVERGFYGELIDRLGELDQFRAVLYRSRIYSLMTRVYQGISGGGGGVISEAEKEAEKRLLGLDVVRRDPLKVSEDERAEARARFEENIRAILDLADAAGVTVVLCTVPSNRSRWAPNGSQYDSGLGLDARLEISDVIDQAEAALDASPVEGREAIELASAALEQARSIAPGNAQVHYTLARSYEALERWDEARAAFILARDLDGSPWRAVSAINDTLRRVAEERDVLLVDVERSFEAEAEHGLLGFNLFEDYVHPKPEGHRLIAFELWRAMLEAGLGGPARTADPADFWTVVGEARSQALASDAEAPSAAAGARSAAQLYNLGIVLINQRRFEEAMENFVACLELTPDHMGARASLGSVLFNQGRYAEAAEQHQRVLQNRPDDPRSLIGLGKALQRLGQLREASEVLGRATRIDGNSAYAWHQLGLTLYEQKRFAEAEVALRSSIAIDEQSAVVHGLLGSTLLPLDRSGEAEAAFRRSLELVPDFPKAKMGLAAVYVDRQEYDAADRLYREILATDPEHRGAQRRLSWLERRRSTRDAGAGASRG